MFSKVFRGVAKAAALTVAGIAVKEAARQAKRAIEEKRAADLQAARLADGGHEGNQEAEPVPSNQVHADHDDSRGKTTQASEADRSTQHAPDGTSVVDEWGEESFPASDAPQSW